MIACRFTEPTDDLSSTHDNPLADTLQQIFDPSGSGSPEGVGYVIWNDDPGVRSPSVKRKINQGPFMPIPRVNPSSGLLQTQICSAAVPYILSRVIASFQSLLHPGLEPVNVWSRRAGL